jgi:hypothetical protein
MLECALSADLHVGGTYKMSQSKVERRKLEKKNRAKTMKKQKIKKVVGWSVFGVIVGCILAATVGMKIYKSIPKYVEAEKLNAFVTETWVEKGYSDLFTSDDTATDTDADEEDVDEDDVEYSDDGIDEDGIDIVDEDDNDIEIEEVDDSEDTAE